jgi:membrane-associated phospholipid phosphatase
MPSEELPPAPVALPFLRTIGLAALVALVSEVVLLPHLVGLDGAVWRAILQVRYAGMDRLVDEIVTWTTRGGFVLVALATVIGMRVGGLRAVWPPLAVCLLGLQSSKLLKNVLLRERPSMLPGTILGHSFPSGHVMNTMLAALAVIVLTTSFRHRRLW